MQLLQPMLLMKLKLQDDSDTLDVFLWKHAVSSFYFSDICLQEGIRAGGYQAGCGPVGSPLNTNSPILIGSWFSSPAVRWWGSDLSVKSMFLHLSSVEAGTE